MTTPLYVADESSPEDVEILAKAEAILLRQATKGPAMRNPAAVTSYLRVQCAKEDRELFGAIYLTTRNEVIAIEQLFFGTIDGAAVHVREVVRHALLHNAKAMVVYHNHPSGNLQPSVADLALTRKLKEACELLEMTLLDHFILTASGSYSFAQSGKL